MQKLPVLLALLLALPAAAQAPTPSTLTVAGEAVVSAPPDRALVRFGVETEGETAEATFAAHEQDVERVLTAVRAMGIADRQIQLEWVGLLESRDGYTAHRVVTVTLDDLRLVPALVATVVEEGANQLHGIEYTLQDPDRYENQALEEAVARAREKAERLAAASGVALGSIVAVAERGVQPPVPMPVMALARADVESTPGAYSAGSREVRAAVVVTFELVDG